jgi:hypothetical protein
VAIPVLRCAEGVQFERIAPGGFRILAALDGATKVLGRDLTITSGTDGHTGGKHPTGEAYDVRTRDLLAPQVLRLYDYLQATLGERFTVLYEVPERPDNARLAAIAYLNPAASGPHIHCQIKKGTTYPPADGSGLIA